MIFERELLKRLPKYEAEGVLDSANAERMQKYLSQKVEKGVSAFWGIFYLAGVISIIVSAVLLMKNYWDDFSQQTQIFVSFVPLAISLFFGGIVLLKKLGVYWREAAAIVNILSFAVMMGLIADIFNQAQDLQSFALFVLIFTSGNILIFRSASACVATIAFNTIFFTEQYHFRSVEIGLAIGLVFSALLILSIIFVLKNYDWRKLITLCVFCIFAYVHLFSLMMNFRLDNTYLSYLICFGFGFIYLMISSQKSLNDRYEYRVLFNVIGFISYVLLAVFLNNSYFVADCSFFKEKPILSFVEIHDVVMLFAFVSAIVVSWVVLSVFAWKNPSRKLGSFYLSLMYLALLIAAFNPYPSYQFNVILSNIAMAVAGFCFAIEGLRKKNFASLNLGVCIFVLMGIIRLFHYDTAILVRALFFGVAGIVFIAVNYWFNRRNKNEN